jgi:hypothetical protein
MNPVWRPLGGLPVTLSLPPHRVRGGLQGLVGNRVSKDFFVSVVERGGGVPRHSGAYSRQHVQGRRALLIPRPTPLSHRCSMLMRACSLAAGGELD